MIYVYSEGSEMRLGICYIIRYVLSFLLKKLIGVPEGLESFCRAKKWFLDVLHPPRAPGQRERPHRFSRARDGT